MRRLTRTTFSFAQLGFPSELPLTYHGSAPLTMAMNFPATSLIMYESAVSATCPGLYLTTRRYGFPR